MKNHLVRATCCTLRFLFVVSLMLISILPILWVCLSSFKTNTEILNSALSLPAQWSLDNYKMAFKIAPMQQFYLNSILVSLLGTLVNVFLLSMAAYAVSRFQFRAKKMITALLSFALVIPPAALLQPLFLTVKATGMYDRILGLVIVYAGFGIPISFYILSSYYLNIPRALEESAYIDGATFPTAFFRIIFPLSAPGLATAGILQFLACWNEFQFALILTTGNKSRTLPIALYYFKSQFASDYGAMFAATILVTLPSIILFLFSQKYVISGMVSGAVKE